MVFGHLFTINESSSDITKKAVDIINEVKQILKGIPRLELEPQKTQYFYYHQGVVNNCGKQFDEKASVEHDIIHFLGISFNGQNVSLRQKAITKYYYRMYRKAKWIKKCKGISPHGKHISNRNLYERYSRNGSQNFISYINRAKDVFPHDQVEKVSTRHMQRIKHAISLT